MVGLLLFGSREEGPLPQSEQTKLAVGLWPLFGIAFAFLAVLNQRVVGLQEHRQPADDHRDHGGQGPAPVLAPGVTDDGDEHGGPILRV